MAKKRKQKTGMYSVWTKPEVIQEVKLMIKDAQDNPTVNTLLSVLTRAQLSADVIVDWEKKFKDDEEVLRIIKELRQIMESRLLERALNNEINAGFTKFLLKAKLGYTEDQSNVTIIKGEKINISFDNENDDDNEEEINE